MKTIYLVTGGCGHLGGTILRQLSEQGETARGLILPHEQPVALAHVTYFTGDVTQPDSLRPFFDVREQADVVVIHTAGVVDISAEVLPQVHRVNVEGTKNMLLLCETFGVRRLVYVSSVHAIPELPYNAVQSEIAHFSAEQVVGGYAKTKAEATQAVLDAAAQGLDAVVVHPSGIIGPYESQENHLVQMLRDYQDGKLPACVDGCYDFVDVRDVAAGCVLAAKKGRRGECYVLSNRRYQLREVFTMMRQHCGGKRLAVLPIRLAKAVAPFFERAARRKGKRPLFTGYALHTLSSNCRFSHNKASVELGYHPRDLRQTIEDTALWLQSTVSSGKYAHS